MASLTSRPKTQRLLVRRTPGANLPSWASSSRSRYIGRAAVPARALHCVSDYATLVRLRDGLRRWDTAHLNDTCPAAPLRQQATDQA